MQITVKLFASFRIKWFKEAVQECQHDAKVVDVVNQIGIPPHELGIILINGRHASLQDTLQNGDTVSLMPLMGGG